MTIYRHGVDSARVHYIRLSFRPGADDGSAAIFGSPRRPEELRVRQPVGFSEVMSVRVTPSRALLLLLLLLAVLMWMVWPPRFGGGEKICR